MTPITITAVGNFVDMMTGTILGLLRSYLLFCLFIFWSWVKLLYLLICPLVHPHVPRQPHHGPPRVAVGPPLDLDGEVLVHHVQGDSAALVLLARGGWLPKTLGSIPINGHFHVKTFFSEDRHGNRVRGDAVRGDDARLLPLPLKNPARHPGRGRIHRMNNCFYFSVNDL